jgi:hypothetical protein
VYGCGSCIGEHDCILDVSVEMDANVRIGPELADHDCSVLQNEAHTVSAFS